LVEVALDAAPAQHWIHEVTSRWPIRVRLEVCRPTGTDQSQLLQAVELIGSPGDLGAAERFLRHAPEIQALTVLPSSPTRRYVRTVTPLPESCQRIFEVGAICARCRFASNGASSPRDRWTLVVPRTRSALRAVARAEDGRSGQMGRIRKIRKFVPPRTLTPRQATALEVAYRLGFYAFPRRSNLREVSRILGVTRATTSELLRRAERKMLATEVDAS
jgi:hypothetical protein